MPPPSHMYCRKEKKIMEKQEQQIRAEFYWQVSLGGPRLNGTFQLRGIEISRLGNWVNRLRNHNYIISNLPYILNSMHCNSIRSHSTLCVFFHCRQTGSKPHNIADTTACIWPAFHHRKRTIDWRSTYVTLVSWRNNDLCRGQVIRPSRIVPQIWVLFAKLYSNFIAKLWGW